MLRTGPPHTAPEPILSGRGFRSVRISFVFAVVTGVEIGVFRYIVSSAILKRHTPPTQSPPSTASSPPPSALVRWVPGSGVEAGVSTRGAPVFLAELCSWVSGSGGSRVGVPRWRVDATRATPHIATATPGPHPPTLVGGQVLGRR
ncbi:hypothetical protein Tco_0386500 [Tanacetum coccineum]